VLQRDQTITQRRERLTATVPRLIEAPHGLSGSLVGVTLQLYVNVEENDVIRALIMEPFFIAAIECVRGAAALVW
jgi:hypothetical protein